MLLALTPNPAIDRVMIVPGFRSAEVCRSTEVRDSAGGKGLNVVRVAQTLGTPACACGPLAGGNGQQIAAMAAAEGMQAEWHWLGAGQSRVCLLITDPGVPDTLTINEPGPQMSAADWLALMDLVRRASIMATAVSSSGSLPPGVSVVEFRAMLAAVAAERPVFLDTSGAALEATLDLPLAMLKINAHEIGAAIGVHVQTPAEACAAALSVRVRGPETVIVTLGSQGAVAVGPSGAWWACPPPIEPITPVGSGDAVLAGMVSALLEGQELPEALRRGVACGAANTLTIGAGVVRIEDVNRLDGMVRVERIMDWKLEIEN